MLAPLDTIAAPAPKSLTSIELWAIAPNETKNKLIDKKQFLNILLQITRFFFVQYYNYSIFIPNFY
jgi:hypothetical protein